MHCVLSVESLLSESTAIQNGNIKITGFCSFPLKCGA